MNQKINGCTVVTATMVVSLFLVTSFVCAAPTGDMQSLERGSVADVTPQQKYQSAIREAGGAYKESLRECANANVLDRKACTREAKATYDRDMAEAKQLLNK